MLRKKVEFVVKREFGLPNYLANLHKTVSPRGGASATNQRWILRVH